MAALPEGGDPLCVRNLIRIIAHIAIFVIECSRVSLGLAGVPGRTWAVNSTVNNMEYSCPGWGILMEA